MGAFDDLIPSDSVSSGVSAGAFDDLIPEQPSSVQDAKSEGRTFGSIAKDVGVTAIKGVMGLDQAAVGLADMVSGGRAGKALDEAGLNFNEAQRVAESKYSPAQQEANRNVREADGFADTLSAAMENPSVIATTVGESIPQMLGGAGIARGLIGAGAKLSPMIAGAIGEGAIGAGSAAESIRGQNADDLLTGKQAVSALASGVGTAAFGAIGGKLAQKLNLADVDTMLAQGGANAVAAEAAKQGFIKQVVGSGISEGVFEELPQSIQEQMWQNFATDKPLTEGVGNAAALGLLSGGVMGGAGGGFNAAMQRTQSTPEQITATVTSQPTLDDAINATNELLDDPVGQFVAQSESTAAQPARDIGAVSNFNTGFGQVNELADFAAQERQAIEAQRSAMLAEQQSANAVRLSSELETTDARVAGVAESEARQSRLAALDSIYANPDERTPGMSFLSHLEANYPNNPIPTPEEKRIIAQREQAYQAFKAMPEEQPVDFGIQTPTAQPDVERSAAQKFAQVDEYLANGYRPAAGGKKLVNGNGKALFLNVAQREYLPSALEKIKTTELPQAATGMAATSPEAGQPAAPIQPMQEQSNDVSRSAANAAPDMRGAVPSGSEVRASAGTGGKVATDAVRPVAVDDQLAPGSAQRAGDAAGADARLPDGAGGAAVRDATGAERIRATGKSVAPLLNTDKTPTGWKRLEGPNNDSVTLVSVDGKRAITFNSTDTKSGTASVRMNSEAHAYAIDNPYQIETPQGELVINPVFQGNQPAKSSEIQQKVELPATTSPSMATTIPPTTPTGKPLPIWQQTRAEYVANQAANAAPKDRAIAVSLAERQHQNAVTFAMRSNKPVSANVLADYPDIQKGSQNAQGPTESQPTAPVRDDANQAGAAQTVSDAVGADVLPIAPEFAVAAEAAKQSRLKPMSRLKAVTDERLSNDANRTELERMKGEFGWAEQGGKLIRGMDGEAARRTKWLDMDERQLWRYRPDSNVSEAEASEFVDKALNGEPLPAKGHRFIGYLLDVAVEREQQYAALAEETQKVEDTLSDEDAALLDELMIEAESIVSPMQYQRIVDGYAGMADTAGVNEWNRALRLALRNEIWRVKNEEGTGQTEQAAKGQAGQVDRPDGAQAGAEGNAGEGFALEQQTEQDLAKREAAQREAEQRQRDEEAQAKKAQAERDQADIDARTAARAANPDNFQFGENSKQAAAPVGDLFNQPTNPETTSAQDGNVKSDDVVFEEGKGQLGRGKWMARIGDTSSNLMPSKEAAEKSLREILDAQAQFSAQSEKVTEAQLAVASKLKAGENPSFNEWKAAFPQLRDGDTYLSQPKISPFLIQNFGLKRNAIKSGIGNAAGDVTSDMGAKYPIVYFNRLADALAQPSAESKQSAPKTIAEASPADLLRAAADKMDAEKAGAPEDVRDVVGNTESKELAKVSRKFWQGETFKDIAPKVIASRDVYAKKEPKFTGTTLLADATEFDYYLTDGRNSQKIHKDVYDYIESLKPDVVAEPESPAYADPYVTLETRPETKPAQLEAGRSSLADVERRIFGRDNSSLRVSASILGSAIPADFREKGYTSLVGQKVESSHDLAMISQVLRDPRFETFRVFFVKDSKIVGERAYTSRLAASVSIPSDLHEQISADMGRTGASGYWLLHNHPAGFAKASSSDINLTEMLATNASGMLGHVIIDHNEYNSITMKSGLYGQEAKQEVIKADLGAMAVSPEVPHPTLGATITKPADFAAIARQLQKDGVYSSIIGTGGEAGAVTMILDVPDMASRKGVDRLRAGAAIRRAARETHSGRLFAVVPGELSQYAHLMDAGLFTDIISQTTGQSAAELGMLSSPDHGTAAERRGLLAYVAEPTAPAYGEALASRAESAKSGTAQTETPEFKRWFGDSKVVDADGMPLVVYHGTGGDFDAFDWSSNRTILNSKYQGDGFHFSEDPRTASRYADAARNNQINKERIFAEVDRVMPPLAAQTFKTVVNDGYDAAWDIPDADIKAIIDEAREAGIDLNDLLDIAQYVEGSNYDKGRDARFDAGMIFGGSSAPEVTEWVRDDAAKLGLDAAMPKNNVMPVYLKAENVLRTSSRKAAQNARSNGFDAVYYAGDDLVGGVPEWIVFRPEQIKSAIGNNGQFDPANPDIRASRSARTTGQTVAAVKQATQALRNRWLGFRKIEIVQSDSDLPQELLDLVVKSGGDMIGTEGLFNTMNNTVYLVADNLPSPERAVWVAIHETVGHGGVRMLGKSVADALDHAAKNSTVSKLARAIAADRGETFNAKTHSDEALAELSAATITDNVDAILNRYGVKVPAIMRQNLMGSIQRIIEAVRTFMAKVLGRQSDAVSDAEVYGLLRQMREAVEGKAQGYDTASGINGALASVSKAIYQTKTEAFRKWFGDSKVVDADGNPLVVYHGTAADVTLFDKLALGESTGAKSARSGFFFAASPEVASGYAMMSETRPALRNAVLRNATNSDVLSPELKKMLLNASEKFSQEDMRDSVWIDRAGGGVSGANVLPVYLSIKNPMVVDYGGKNYRERKFSDVIAEAKSTGHDGVVFRNAEDSAHKEYSEVTDIFVAFESTQIKSAIGNNGQFDGSNPSILASRAPVIIGDSGNYDAAQRAALERTGSVITKKTISETLHKLKQDAWKKMAQGLADQFRPIRDLDMHAYNLLRLSKGATGAFEAFMHYGKLSLNDGATDADQSGGVLEKVFFPLGKESTDFLRWIAGNRAERLMGEGKERLFNKDDIAAFKSLADRPGDFATDYTLIDGTVTRDRKAIYKDSLVKFNEFNKNVLDIAEQSGLIDGDSRKLWEHEFYVPFYRVAEENEGEARGMYIKSGVIRQEAFKKLKGGEEQLNDLLANTMGNWAHLIDASAKNRAARETMEAAYALGVARYAEPGDKKTVWYMDKGSKVEMVVDDPYIVEAISSLEFSGIHGPMMDILSKPKHWLTIGVTASPFFKIRNLVRDSVQAIATSDLNYNPAANVVEGWKLTNRKKPSQQYVSALAGGGLIRFGTMLEGNEASRVRQLIKQGAKDEHILDDEGKIRAFYDKYVEPSITMYNELGNRGEEVNRMSLYHQLRAKGMGHAEASVMSRDLMDFSMQGSWKTVRFLTQLVPFLNARIQGMYKLGRASTEDKARFAVVLGAVTMVSLALLAMYGDDDDWKRREDWDRDNYWWFKIGGVAFRVPKPFEIGAIATLAERTAEFAFDKEMTGQRFADTTTSLIANQLAMNPVPQTFKPMIDLYANKDSFSKRPIESMGMERLEPGMRYNQNTSMLARGVSSAGNALTGDNFLSPVQLDFLNKAYFGWLGATAVSSADMMVRGISNEPTRPAVDHWKLATGGMVAELSGAQSRYVSMMYDQAAELEQAHATYNRLRKDGKIEDAKEYREDHKEELSKYRKVENVKRSISKINERIRMIERSSKSADEKRALVIPLRERQSELANRLYQ